MLDALVPAATAFARRVGTDGDLAAATRDVAAAAAAGSSATAGMHPRLGRASYLGAWAVGERDAGAVAVAAWLQALAR